MSSETSLAEQLAPAVGDARAAAAVNEPWWHDAVVYQVYVRSFADGNSDGTGDLDGVRSRLPYLEALGVDALWFTPWYRSPLADGGYDVADYRDIDPAFGGLEQAEQLIAEAAARGIRTIVDIVPNHVSDRHPWFQDALAAGPGSPERERFWFRPGRGPKGDEPPTDWVSSFGGSTWTRVVEPDGRAAEWYLHLFSSEQPDLNWDHPDVRTEHEDVLRFWFDRGVAGIRIDSAAFLVKDAALPIAAPGTEAPGTDAPGTDAPGTDAPGTGSGASDHPYLDRDGVHDIYRAWRRVVDAYDPPRLLVGEVWLAEPDRFARYLRPDELHSAFNFDFMTQPWSAAAHRRSIEQTLEWHGGLEATPTWALSNHDLTRPVTRYGRAESGFSFDAKRFGVPRDLDVGLARARAAAMLVAALPGSLYVYQGDELGLPEVEDLPLEALTDPMHARSGGTDPGRDGCRVPLPWRTAGASLGFADGAAAPWLPQPAEWSARSVEAQDDDPTSTLSLYRAMLALRRDLDPGFEWIEHADPHVIAFRRGDLVHLTNFGDDAVALPSHRRLLLASGPTTGEELPGNTSAWLEL